MLPPEFSQFCASLLQAQWKRYIIRNAYLKLRKVRIDYSLNFVEETT